MNDEDLAEIELKARLEQEAEIAARRKAKLLRESKQAEEDAAKLPPLPDNADIRESARAVENEIFRTYYDMMVNPETPAAVRKSCADALADRARGKPAQDGTKKDKDENKPTTKIGNLKEKILKAIPNDKLDALLSEIHSAGIDSGEEEENVQQD